SQVRVLAASLAESNPGLELYVLLVDRPDNKFDPDEEPYHLMAIEDLHNIPNPQHFFFKYDPIELNTAVKPYFLEHLFKQFGLQKLCYFDPDIYVFGDLQGVWDLLEYHGVVMTPHITAPYQDDRRPTELDLVRAGIFNLGFLAIARNERTGRLLEWWKTRLYDYGYMQPALGMHVDQSWMAFAPAFQDDVFVLRDPAYNIAYWNLHERGRRLQFTNQRLMIDHRPTVFFHFSGMEMENLNVISRHQNRFTLNDFENLRPLFEFYRRTVELHGREKTRKWGYAFGRFDNGVEIPAPARRLYGGLAHDLTNAFGNPFATASEGSFFRWMNQSAAPMDAPRYPIVTRLHMELHRQRPDLQRAFPDPLGADRERFKAWICERGADQVGLDRSLLAQDDVSGLEPAAASVPPLPFRVKVRRLAYSARDLAARRLRGRLDPESRVAVGLRSLDQRIFGAPTPEPSMAPIQPPAELPFGVNVAGYIEGEFGVAEGARASLEALSAVGVPHALNNIRAEVHRNLDTTFRTFAAENPYRVNLMHVNADQVPRVRQQQGPEYFQGRHNIGYWFWELSQFPDVFQSSFEPFQEIWVASGFVQDSISRASPIPVIKMPFPVLVGESPDLIGRADLGLPEDQYIFGFSFDYLSVPERKNPLGVVEAFGRAFGDRDKALLLIKSINAAHAPEQAAALRQAAGSSNVRFIESHLSRLEMLALSASLDCY
ncbi:MAG TPA: hypothetical protein VFH29_01675, partial [Anaerolineales bacterium]|nr:hypothetical protein [Anaerolineales bacterium]